MSETRSPREVVAALPPLGVSYVASGRKTHVVSRRREKTLCGKVPLSLFGRDLRSKREVTCGRCYALAFVGVNASAPGTPDEAVT